MGWVDEANCKGSDPRDFFIKSPSEIPRGAYLCRTCKVQATCRNWALDNNEYNYWGGTNETERRTLRIRRVIAANEEGHKALSLQQSKMREQQHQKHELPLLLFYREVSHIRTPLALCYSVVKQPLCDLTWLTTVLHQSPGQSVA